MSPCRALIPASLLGALLLLSMSAVSAPAPDPPAPTPGTAAPPQVLPRYRVIPLGHRLIPTDINNRGQILFSTGERGQILTDGDSVTVQLLPGGSSAGYVSGAFNDRGDTVLIGPDGAFLRTASNSIERLAGSMADWNPMFADTSRMGQSISNTGQCFVAISVHREDSPANRWFLTPFLWEKGNAENLTGKYWYQELPGGEVLSGSNGLAEQARFTSSSSSISKQAPGRTWCLEPRDANDAGHIAGLLLFRTSGTTTDDRAGYWNGKQVQRLPELPGCIRAWSYGLNNADDIVGYCIGPATGARATLWRSNGEAIDLNYCLSPDSGWHLNRALRINDSGYILGIGYSIGNGTTGKAPDYFLLAPLPEQTAPEQRTTVATAQQEM